MEIIKGLDSLVKKVRTRGYLAQIEDEIGTELEELKAIKAKD